MKLIRFGAPGRERPGVIDRNGNIRALDDAFADLPPLPSLEAIEALRGIDLDALPLVEPGVRLAAPIVQPSKIIACGLNYHDHVTESGLSADTEPTFFLKAPSSLSGPDDPIVIPPGATQLDWEVELAVVVGREGAYLSESEAAESIAGYAVFNDVSERFNQFQRGAGQWTKGKSADTFGPLGPYLVTPDELDVGNLDIWLELNGKRLQFSNTREMIFSPAQIVAYASQFMRLQVGDLVATGTPAGVGMGQEPPFYLKPGDRLRLGIDGLGEQASEIVSYDGRPARR